MPTKNRPLILAFLTLFTLCPAALGQTFRGAIRGVVSDPSQRPISGAKLTLISAETGDSRTALSGATGDFAFALLAPGKYKLEIEFQGFKKTILSVQLDVNAVERVDPVLTVGTLTDQVLIDAPRSGLKKDSASLGAVIDNSQVIGLPLDGRNFLELSLLVPGAAPAAQGSSGTVRGDFAFNVNGSREDSNAFLLDGVYNVDPKLNAIGVRPPVDAIREFEVLASTYDASFGRNAGAQVNVVLKSGSNRFHGTAYEFFRNKVLDARNFFAPPSEGDPQYQRNQFGGSIGGPIIQNRTFFFADYEGTRLREGLTRITNVPTLAERNGNFSQSVLPKPVIPGSNFPFPGNQIPDIFIDPIGKRIAALYPLPNRNVPLQNFVSSPARKDRDDLFDARVDHSLNDRSQITARYSFTDRDLFEPFSGATFALIPGFGTRIPRRAQNTMLSETHVFSPSFVNDVRVAYNRVALQTIQEGEGVSLNKAVGMPELSSNPRDWGLSFITLTGYSPLGDEYNNPQSSVTNLFQVLDTATWTRGANLFKFGVDIRVLQQNAFRDVQSRGFLTFSSLVPVTGNALADLLIGAPILTGGARLDNPQHLRAETYGFFINDSIRLNPALTVNLGLRYEYNSPPVDVEDRANVYDPATRTLVRVGTNGIPRAGYENDANNLAPRVGLAWTASERLGTVVRGGYGVYYDQSPLAPGEGLYFNAPYFNLSIYFPLPGLPISLSNPFPSNYPFPTPPSAFAFQSDLKTGYVQHWNVNLQQQIGRSSLFEVGYVGSKGTKLLAGRDINQAQPSANQQNPRPNPQFQDILFQESSASSTYHALQARYQQRLSYGVTALASYTWSKSIDNASNFFQSTGDPNFPQNSYNLAAERGRSNFDVAHRFSASFSYDLPFGKGQKYLSDGWAGSVFGGWQTLGIVSLQTGRPFTVALLGEIDWTNTGRANLGFGNNDRPNMIGNAALDNPTIERWFNTSAFVFPAPGNFGNAGRNVVDGPDYQNLNFSIVKNTMVSENLNLQFRTEFFNLFNHPNFDLPDNFVGSPTFGRISSAQSPRHIQFGLKLIF